MHVAELWRYPVKSLQGEQLDEAVVEDSGLAGDRRWGIVDGETGMVLTARRVPALLLASARRTDTGVEILLPDGEVLAGPSVHADEVLLTWIGRRVALVHAETFGAGVGEYFEDATDDESAAVSWTMPESRFVDALPLLVITTASLRQGRALHPDGAWETRRFRPNIVVDVDDDGWVEDAWCGSTVRVGAAVVQPAIPCQRCTMVTRPQPGLDRDLDVFKALAASSRRDFWCLDRRAHPWRRARRRRGDDHRLTAPTARCRVTAATEARPGPTRPSAHPSRWLPDRARGSTRRFESPIEKHCGDLGDLPVRVASRYLHSLQAIGRKQLAQAISGASLTLASERGKRRYSNCRRERRPIFAPAC